MITDKGDEVIICEKCHRLWLKHKAEEKAEGKDNE